MINKIKNNERGNEDMKKFDMDKVIKYVVDTIKNSEVKYSDKSISARDIQSALYFGEDTMTEQEDKYCQKVLHLIELYNSSDFIKELYSAEGTDIFEVVGQPNNLFEVPSSDKLRELYIEGEQIKKEIIRDYAFHKLPIMKELLNKFLEWKKEEIEYEYLLSELMSVFEYDDVVNINDCIVVFIRNSIVYTSILTFTDFERDSEEGIIWENIQSLIDCDFLVNEYQDTLYEFRKELLKTYRI